MTRTSLLTMAVAAFAVAIATAPRAQPSADETAVRQRLEHWTAAFNAKDVAGSCDLFAPDLAYSIQDVVNGTYQTMCGNLTRILGRSDIRLHYDVPAIKEIIVSGDIAAVRLTWTLTVERGGAGTRRPRKAWTCSAASPTAAGRSPATSRSRPAPTSCFPEADRGHANRNG